MEGIPPDILLIGAEWPQRALIRAELIEAGHQVIALDAWPIPKAYQAPGMKPRVVVIDLHGLRDPRTVLEELPTVVPCDRVLVITSLGAPGADELRQIGYSHTLARPVTIREVVNAAGNLLEST